MKIGVLLAAGLAAALLAGCSETGRGGYGYERRSTVVIEQPGYGYDDRYRSGRRYDRRGERREWDRGREARRDDRGDRRRRERRESRDDDRREDRRDRDGRSDRDGRPNRF